MEINVRQIAENSKCFPAECRGKWYCSANDIGSDGHRVNRYLQSDGNWGPITKYFDNEDEIQALREKGEQPDFTLGIDELMMRVEERQMMEEYDHFDDQHRFDDFD
jgi:hypothetical protein